MLAENGLVILERVLAEKKYQDSRTSFEFPDAVNKIIEQKGCLPKQVFNTE